MRQKSVEVEGLQHNAPIPLGCRIGPIFASSGIGGRDPETGKMPAEPERQAFHCFDNLKRVLAAAGLDLGDVVKMTVFVADEGHRDAINKYWLECYPDPHQRPARHTLVMPLRGGMVVQLEVLAVAKEA
jgi:2-iminobutanoate/2-iminopropanoate deaminase